MNRAKKWPCFFVEHDLKKMAFDRLYTENPKTNFGAYTALWRKYHCPELNPYGSEHCPYALEDCAIAFLIAGQRASMAKTSRVGLFRHLAQDSGAKRADNKPLARERYSRTDGQQSRPSGLRDGAQSRPTHVLGERPGVPGKESVGQVRYLRGDQPVDLRRQAPRSIGSLLGGDGAGPRVAPQGRDQSQETTDHDGDPGNPVSPPPSGRLGNQP